MASFRRICFRRALAGILFAACGLCFSGYIISDNHSIMVSLVKIYSGFLFATISIVALTGYMFLDNHSIMVSLVKIYSGFLFATISIVALTGYMFLDTTIYSGTFNFRLTKSQNAKSPKDTEPYDVIILTYMRSGSSFIGKLVGFREDTFYWYEPLWKTYTWQFYSTGQMVCNYRKDGCRNVTRSASSVQNSLRFLLDVYKCNLKGHIKQFTRFQGTPRMTGATGQVFYNCSYPDPNCKKRVKVKPKNCNNCTSTKLKCSKCPPKPRTSCYDKWIKRCNTTKHKATKVLRMDTSHAKYLLENHKRLKLIQIFRDPRAIMSSRKRTGWYYTGNYTPTSDAKVLCKRMENDLASAQELKSLYPDRVKIIQYEDFYDPNRTAKILFDFLNMKMTDYVESSILAPLYVENPKNRQGFHPDSYRYKFDPKSILISNRYCQNVFKNLGLRMFNSTNEIKNKSLSVILDKLPYPLN